MAIQIKNTYSGRTDNTDPNYPWGKGRNVVGGVEGTGTPFEAQWYNNLEGFLQGLLLEAGVTPDGQVDNANSSQLVEAVKGIIWGERFKGTFKQGLTYTSSDDVGLGQDGLFYKYVGEDEYPVVVTAGTVPSVAAGYQQVTFNSAENVKFNDNSSVQAFKDSAPTLTFGRVDGDYKFGDVIKIESMFYDHTMTAKASFTLSAGESLLDKIESGLLDVQSTRSLRPFEYPSGWNGSTPDIFWSGGNSYSIVGWSEKLFRESYIVKPYGARTKTYYATMDGDDSNGGLSESDALRTVNAALAKSDCLTVMLKGGGHYSMTTVATYDVNIIGYDGVATIFTIRAAAATGSFVQENVYSFTDTIQSGVPVSGIFKDEFGTPIPYKAVGSVAEVAANQLTYYKDGTTTYVHASNTPINGEDIFICPKNFGNSVVNANGNNSGNVLYMESLLFPNSIRAVSDLNYPLMSIYGLNVTAANNLEGSIDNAWEVTYCNTYLNRCNASYSYNDGFNYDLGDHIEYRCVARANYDSSGSNQASTTHNASPILRVDCDYETSNQNVILDVDDEVSINIGVVASSESVTPVVSFGAAAGRTMYCYDCTPLSRDGLSDGHYRNDNTGSEIMVIDGILSGIQARKCTLDGE